MRRGSFEPNLRKTREMLKTRRDAMLAALEKHLAGRARWTRPEGGFFIWLEMEMGVDMRAVPARAEGVTAVDATEFSVAASKVRLSYSSASPDEIEAGIARIAAALDEPGNGP